MVSLKAREPSKKVVMASEAMVVPISAWYESKRTAKGSIDSNVMCAGLYITEFLACDFPLTRDMYAAESQVKGASGAKAKSILGEHGEHRRFTSEGGRTSRYTIRHAETLADVINKFGEEHGIADLSDVERLDLSALLQGWFVGKVREDYFGKKRISAEIDPGNSVRTTVANLIAAGRERGGTTAGAIAQHLVGAKLKIRFPDADVNVESYTTADVQTGRAGDYEIGDTALHVTMAPGEKVFRDRCAHNLREGFRPRVLVPEDAVAAAVQIARLSGLEKKIAIQSIEDFVGTNIEETAGFTKDEIRVKLRELLELYNQRIETAESDMSLKIEIPSNL
ncbi:DUF4928 family protein [Streptomyces barkulensis]|uniref:DUF4928 family protein n=1 Tax=Streptomyces barkulensis TaxID=1257026 RepID=UPI00130461EC|nr:DUF4928 family protein [Streptomyces barkulensis]